MADQVLTKQKLIDADEDVQALEDVVNGEPGQLIKTRLGREVYTLASVPQINTMTREEVDSALALKAPQDTTYSKTEVDSALSLKAPQSSTYTKAEVDTTFAAYVGGRKAYTTLALAQAAQSSLPANTAIEVTNDPDPTKNGTYQWNGTTLTKSAYDPLTQAKSLIKQLDDKLVTGIFGLDKVDITSELANLPQTLYASSSENKWTGSGYSGVLLDVNAGDEFDIVGSSSGYTKVMFVLDGEIIGTNQPLINVSFPTGSGFLTPNQEVTITAPDDVRYLWITHSLPMAPNGGGLPSKISKVLKIVEPLGESITEIYRFLSQPVPIDPSVTIYNPRARRWIAVEIIEDNTSVYAVELPLNKGDVLSFNYSPINGVILWDWRDSEAAGKAFPLHTHTYTSDEALSHEFVAYTDMVVRVVNAKNNTLKVNGNAFTNYVDLGLWRARMKPEITTIVSGIKSTGAFSVKKGTEVTITRVATGFMAIGYVTPAENFIPIFGTGGGYPQGSSYTWVADSDLRIILSGLESSEFLIREPNSYAKGGSLDARIKKIAGDASLRPSSSYEVPDVIDLGELTSVFATSMNYILDTQMINGVDHIRISTDLGKTYNVMPNILGDIVHCHFFSDGTIMLCSPTKVYWTDDYQTLNESTVYDHDGSVFIPTSRHFFAMQNSDKVMYIGDKEIFVWGDYILSGTPRIWYSTDRGRTIKCAAKFGTTIMDGAVRKVRHVHRICYRKKDESFYITTGDHGTDGAENMVLRGNYDFDTDTWSWKYYNQGWNYKFGAIFFDDVYAYLLTDYTNAWQQDIQGFYRVLPEHLGDFSKYQAIYKPDLATLGETAFSRFFMDKMGNKVILPDWKGFGVIWVAREGMNFKRVVLAQNVWLAYMIGANYNGDIYNVAFDNFNAILANNGANIKLNRGTYNITKALRNNGISDFMRGHTLIDELGSISENP